ncbi:MAG: hypothetical protein AAF721_12850 [Myxococcota bacterium]
MLAGAAPAEPPGFELQWTAPATCPSQAEVDRRIESNLRTSTASDVDVYAEADVSETDGEFRLALRFRDVSGERVVTSRDCRELADAAAFIVSIAIDPTLTPAPPQPEPPPEPEPEPEPVVAPAPPVPPPRPAAPVATPGEPDPNLRRGQLVVRIDGGPSLGALPALGGSLGVAIGGQLGRARVEAVGRFHFPQEQALAAVPDAGARFMVGVAAQRGCAVPAVSRVEFPLCAGIELGSIRATGFGVDAPQTEHRLWGAIALSPSIVVRFGSVALWGGVDVAPLWVRPRFEIRGGGTVHRMGPVMGRALAGVEFRWPATKTPGGGK